MIKTIINAFKIADIRKKLLFTAFIILIFRIGSVIPVPFVNIVDGIDVGKGNTIMTYLSLMTGSAFTYGTFFAMSITPYINASIIMQRLAVAIPALERLAKEGLDVPCLDRLLLATPVKDYAIVVQSVGRIARVYEGKGTPVVYDYVDDIGFLQGMWKKRCASYRKDGCIL